MESIVRDEIVNYLMQNEILCDDQHGFVPGRDCVTQLLTCIEIWTQLVEDGHNFDVIYTDFAKAFDSVPHKRLFVKLKSIGITGNVLNWNKSFLRDRTQCVQVDGVKSFWKLVLSGIPQGSVLGPILFICFINDLPLKIKHNICKLFADDCKLFGIVKDCLTNTLEKDLQKIHEWSVLWQLPFNELKCKVLHVGRNNPDHIYMINNHQLEVSEAEKDLGLIVDKSLKFHEHVASVVKKANQILGMIKKTYITRDANTIKLLYTSLVRPHLEYCNVIWGPHYIEDKRKVESIQRRATKCIRGLHDMPYEERLRTLKLPSLEYRRKRGDLINCFKIMNNYVRLPKEDFFTPIPLNITRGHTMRIQRKKATKRTRIDNFSQRIVKSWNEQPPPIVLASSINSFKAGIDEHFKDDMYSVSFL